MLIKDNKIIIKSLINSEKEREREEIRGVGYKEIQRRREEGTKKGEKVKKIIKKEEDREKERK